MRAGAIAWRVTKGLLATLATIVVFAVALVMAILLHLESSPARRLVSRELPVLLDGALPGTLRVHALGALGLRGVRGVDIDLVHPDGVQVARLRGVDVTLDPVRAAAAFLGDGPIEIPIQRITIQNIEIDASMKKGQLRIAEVFVDPNEPAAPDDPGARGVDVRIGDLDVRHLWAHGRIEADGPIVDVDLDGLRGSFALDPDGMRVSVLHVDIVTRSAPRGADVRAALRAEFATRSAPQVGEAAQSAFYVIDGTAAGSPLWSVGALKGETVHAWVSLPEITPTQLRDVAPEAPTVGAPIALGVVVDGTFRQLTSRVNVAVGTSRIELEADAVLEPSLSARTRVHAVDLDAALVGGPASQVSLDLDAEVAIPDGEDPRGSAHLVTLPGTIAGIPIPAVVGQATLAKGAAHAEIDVQEPGMRAALVADVKEGPRGVIVDATVKVPDADLSALRRRGYEATGRAKVLASAHLDLGAETVAATVKLDAVNLSAALAPGVRVGSLKLDARANGSLKNPEVHARTSAYAVAAAGRDIQWASATVDGPALRPRVAVEVSSLDVPHVRAGAWVDVQGGPALDGITVEARRGTTTARLAVRRVVLGSGIPTVDHVRLDGLGEPMTLSVRPEGAGGIRVAVSAPRISIPAVTDLAGVDVGVRGGRLSLHGDMLIAPTKLDGVIDLDVQGVDLRREDIALDALDLSVKAELRGRRVTFAIDGETRSVGSVHLQTTKDLELAGPPMKVASWRDAVGVVDVKSDVRLESIARLIPRDRLPVGGIEGLLSLRGEVGRQVKGSAPSLELRVETHELAIPAWTLRGIDVVVQGKAAPDPARLEWDVTARDGHGELVTAELTADLAYDRFLAGGPLDLEALEDAPLTLKVAIPSRKVADLPPMLGVPSMPGNVVLDATLEGTLREPKLSVDGALAQLSIDGSPLEQPFTVKLLAKYDGREAHADVALDQSTSRLLKATADARVALRDLLHPEAGRPLPWTASADVKLGPLPLAALEAVIPTKIEGIATGHIKLDKLHEDASLDADVSVEGLVLGGIRHREAKLTVRATGGRAEATVSLVQPQGSLDVDAKTGIAWGARVVPELRVASEFAVGVRARSFRLRVAEPFLTSVLNRLDGRLDGEVRLSKEALTDATRGRGVKGKLSLSQGSVEVAAGGGPLEAVRATVRVDDSGVVRLEDVYARGSTGEVRAAGLATFGPAGFSGARLNVEIPEKKPMPLLLSGQHLADVSASVKVTADLVDQRRELKIGVDIPRLDVSLPDSLPEGVQTLDDIERVRIGTLRKGSFIPLAVDAPDPVDDAEGSALRVRVGIALREARIVKGDMLSTYLRGNPSILIDNGKNVMSGAIRLNGGRVDIKGRRFEIESGTITFTGDPTNPDVLLTAKWKAPDDTVIYADFAGPLQTGKVTLRSDPPRSREEILALVIFGRVEGYSSGGQEADKGTQAVGAAGGFATAGLNKVLDDVTDLEIRTRVDTSSSANPRPELEVQISQEIAARIAYVLGELAPGQAADRTFATIDWSFLPEWSLETTVGDKASTTVDMIWERRY